MFYIAARRSVAALLLVAAGAATAAAADHPPTTLQEPVFGLRIELAKATLEALPEEVLGKCADLANAQESMRLWVYGTTVDAGRRYFVVGGYYIRHEARTHGTPKYTPDTRGVVFYVQGENCVLIGQARETFDARFFEETPQPVLQRLAEDLAKRLTQAFGGADRLRLQFQRQKMTPNDLPAELQEAFGPIISRPAR